MKYIINPGAFKQPIEIQELFKGKGPNNLPSEEWRTIFSCNGKVKNTSGNETLKDIGVESTKSKLITIRYPKNIDFDPEDTKRYRVIYKDKELNISYMNDVEDLNVYLEIVVELVK